MQKKYCIILSVDIKYSMRDNWCHQLLCASCEAAT